MTWSSLQKSYEITDSQSNLKDMSNVSITLSADGLAPLGDRPSADIVMVKFMSYIRDWHLEVQPLKQLDFFFFIKM